MPIYEYQCQSCGQRSEHLQRMADPALTTCEACGGPLKRLISAPAVQFKGSGWYVTDYAGKKGGGSQKDGSQKDGSQKDKEKGEAAGGEGKPSAGGESKSADGGAKAGDGGSAVSDSGAGKAYPASTAKKSDD